VIGSRYVGDRAGATFVPTGLRRARRPGLTRAQLKKLEQPGFLDLEFTDPRLQTSGVVHPRLGPQSGVICVVHQAI
jgi:hypothetical protein